MTTKDTGGPAFPTEYFYDEIHWTRNAPIRRHDPARLLRGEGFQITEIAKFYGISRQGLSHAVTGKNWLAERAK